MSRRFCETWEEPFRNVPVADIPVQFLNHLFQRLGFHRVSPSGHTEKALEFGKDLWMKYQLPTSHWIYFCAQIKKDKIDSNAASGSRNASWTATNFSINLLAYFLIFALTVL